MRILKENLVRLGKRKNIPVVVCAEEEELLKAIVKVVKEEIVDTPILIGNARIIVSLLEKMNVSKDNFIIYDCLDKVEASRYGVKCILEGNGNFLIKGLVDTSIILKEILNEKEKLSENGNIFFSHVTVVETRNYAKPLIFGDAAMNILPNVKEKIKIIENCYRVSHSLGIKKPKIALLAAKEKVSPKMIATQDAKEIVDILINDNRFIVEGPLALDNAISKRAAQVKGIEGKIQGDADILIMPNIETGNVFYKAMCYLTESKSAGVLIGAKVPIVITSRADTEESKYLSMVLASII